MKKGISHILEAIIAVTILMLALVFYFRPLNFSQTYEINYKIDAYNGLKIMEETGKLREYALADNATAIKNDLLPYIYLDYEVVIYNKTSNLTTIPSITADDIISVSYFLAGDIANYSAKEVKVLLWGFD